MKPEILILSGWGPYRDKVEVDFTRLEERGLFLITGATGAGKTTLFDAITYALYGYLSGEMREKNSVRSDFAGADTATFVELLMRHGDKEYRILRNPEYLRPKRRQSGSGELTKEKENAVLYMPDGSVIQGSSEVNRKLQEILVLDYRQYKQISMIAQGEVARLLSASPAEKTRIFREIFSTAVYDRFAGILRSHSNELYKQVMECRHRMEEDIHMLSSSETEDNEELSVLLSGESYRYDKIIDCLGEALSGHEEAFSQAKKAYLAVEKEITVLMETISLGEQINGKLLKLEKENETIRVLKENQDEIDKKTMELKKARAAAGLNGDYIGSENEKKLLTSLFQKEQEGKTELERLTSRTEELRPLYDKKDRITAAYESRNVYEGKKKLLIEITEQRTIKEEELCKLQKEYLEKETAAEGKKEAYEAADKIYKRAAVGIAARLLKEGEPCPVCGSYEHPHIAEITENVPDEEKLKALRDNYQKANRSLMEIHGKTSSCKGEVQGRMEQEEDVKRQLKEVSTALEGMEKDVLEVVDKMSHAEYEKIVVLYQRIHVQMEERAAACGKIAQEITIQRKRAQEAQDSFEGKYKASGFPDFQSFRQSVRSSAQIEFLENEINDYYRKIEASEHMISHLQEETKGEKPADIGILKEVLKEKREERQSAISLQNKWNYRLQEVKKIRKSLQEKQERVQGLNREYGAVKDLDNLASGNNPKRLVFEQYVLAGYFEEILRAANVRLSKMTGGRFELSRAEEVSDGRTKDNLEMQVFDYYTGKCRSVKTLSGGESFKASLSLALGMSDVIQSYSGGIRVETLFIDEGFGSLDAESLEQACQTLMSLVEKDRLIGIISHVPELSEKIEKQIVVTKTNVGSSIKVMV
ncbi:exonuclease SbcC [Kineothrix alysoides]|uniref:Nuclease SbcCD subunit C n=1 Tax=Kineothrix alysoides TaxID=1469948 RepID=A0A4R1R5R2_9FIRM|nr:SMC family ATPase [Kineothrix alysoides]TCL60632.1 exonuclease SbcC [Kineothrix alysoides]